MKKKRIVKLEPQTVELFAEVLSKLRPPPPLTVSQWADRYRVLSAESSAEPGRWHTEKAPYQRAIMDAIGDPHVRSVVVMSAAQIGKTDAFILNPLGYYMDYAPCPVMCMQPTLDMGQTLSKDRIAPMIRDTPRLTGLVDTKSRYAGNTVMKKNFPGGHITIVGANSPSSLASRPIKVLLADEIDRYPKSAGTEGDPLDLAKKRQTTFWDYKTVMVSTPTIKGDSRIEDAYLLSTQEEWNVPCPECGAYQPFLWENVKFDKDDLDKGIGYVCRECGCVSNEYRWKEQGKYGKYVAANPGAESRGFHLNTLASTFVGWKEIVTKFIEAKIALDHGNPEQMKVWVNTELGETWEERGIQLEDIELFNRREIYAAELTAAVISAMFTVFIKKSDQSDEVPFGEMLPPDVQVDTPDKTSVELAPGAFIDLNPGEEVQFADPKHPTTGFEAFMNAIVKQMAAALEIPSEVLYKQFSTSYSAARGALNEFWRTTGMHRDWFADSFCQPVYEAWFREAVCKGRIKAPGFLTNPAVAAAYMNCNWNGPARTNLNPKDEAEAAQMRVNSGFSTAAQETAQMTGGSYEANMRQRKAEAALKREVDEIAGAQVQQQTAVPQRSGGDPGKSE